jgi:hypothetical protein
VDPLEFLKQLDCFEVKHRGAVPELAGALLDYDVTMGGVLGTKTSPLHQEI